MANDLTPEQQALFNSIMGNSSQMKNLNPVIEIPKPEEVLSSDEQDLYNSIMGKSVQMQNYNPMAALGDIAPAVSAKVTIRTMKMQYWYFRLMVRSSVTYLKGMHHFMLLRWTAGRSSPRAKSTPSSLPWSDNLPVYNFPLHLCLFYGSLFLLRRAEKRDFTLFFGLSPRD